MKITKKAIIFIQELHDQAETNASKIVKELGKLVDYEFCSYEIRELYNDGCDIKLIRPRCGRGCCSESTIGSIDVSLQEINYPSLWINRARTEYKENRKIEGVWLDSTVTYR